MPFYDFKAERTRLLEGFKKREETDIEAEAELEPTCTAPPRPKNGLKQYWITTNTKSLDGLPGLLSAYNSSKPFMQKDVVFKKDIEGTESSTWLSRLALVSGLVDPKVIVAFALGVVASAAYSKYVPAQGLIAFTI